MKNTKTTIIRNLALAVCAIGLLNFTRAAEADNVVHVAVMNYDYPQNVRVTLVNTDFWGNPLPGSTKVTTGPVAKGQSNATLINVPVQDVPGARVKAWTDHNAIFPSTNGNGTSNYSSGCNLKVDIIKDRNARYKLVIYQP